MIKWLWYLKYLKLSLIGLWISFFMGFLGNSVNAWYIWHIWTTQDSVYNSSYQILVNKQWNFLTSYFWLWKRLFMIDRWTYFFWDINNIPYMSVVNSWNISYRWEWRCTSYLLCDYIWLESWSADSPQNCQKDLVSYGSDFQAITERFLKSIWNSWYYYYDYYFKPYSIWGSFVICFSSSEFNKSLCFYGSNWINYDWGGLAWNMQNYYWYTDTNLNNSLWLSTDFDLIDVSYIWNGPGFWGWSNSEWSVDINLDAFTSISWDYQYSSCTNWQIIQNLEAQWMSKYLCYWWLDNFDLYDSNIEYNPIPWSWLRLSQILSQFQAQEWDTPAKWFNFWNAKYLNRYSNPDLAWWGSYPAVYKTYFDLYYQYWGDLFIFDTVREYCVMTVDLNIDRNATYNWTYFKDYCTWVQEWGYEWHNYSQVGSWNIYGTNWNWIWNISWSTPTSQIWFMQDMFNKIKTSVKTNDYLWWLWFLPKYIIVFLLALILFRFISH